jgi:hypothetical protein
MRVVVVMFVVVVVVIIVLMVEVVVVVAVAMVVVVVVVVVVEVAPGPHKVVLSRIVFVVGARARCTSYNSFASMQVHVRLTHYVNPCYHEVVDVVICGKKLFRFLG